MEVLVDPSVVIFYNKDKWMGSGKGPDPVFQS